MLIDTGYCKRKSLITDLKTNLEKHVQNYARLWKALNNLLIDDLQILQIINKYKSDLFNFIENYVGVYPDDDNVFCNRQVKNDIRPDRWEVSNDVFIMIDVNGCMEEQILYVTELVRRLDLGPNGGSVTVLANAHSNGSIPDGNNHPILTSLVYNTTSSQVASCRVASFDNRMLILF